MAYLIMSSQADRIIFHGEEYHIKSITKKPPPVRWGLYYLRFAIIRDEVADSDPYRVTSLYILKNLTPDNKS